MRVELSGELSRNGTGQELRSWCPIRIGVESGILMRFCARGELVLQAVVFRDIHLSAVDTKIAFARFAAHFLRFSPLENPKSALNHTPS